MKNIDAYETEAVVDATASVRVGELPFATGDHVRVLVLRTGDSSIRRHSEEEVQRSKAIRQGLKGTILKYDRPDEPAVPTQ